MSLILAAALLLTPGQTPPAAAPSTAVAPDPAVVDAARAFLALTDAGNWADSYQSWGSAFHKLNTLAAWTSASESGRAPLGGVRSRILLDQQELPAPPHGYQVLRFRTSFAAKPDTIETLSFVREGNAWRVAGYIIG